MSLHPDLGCRVLFRIRFLVNDPGRGNQLVPAGSCDQGVGQTLIDPVYDSELLFLRVSKRGFPGIDCMTYIQGFRQVKADRRLTRSPRPADPVPR